MSAERTPLRTQLDVDTAVLSGDIIEFMPPLLGNWIFCECPWNAEKNMSRGVCYSALIENKPETQR